MPDRLPDRMSEYMPEICQNRCRLEWHIYIYINIYKYIYIYLSLCLSHIYFQMVCQNLWEKIVCQSGDHLKNVIVFYWCLYVYNFPLETNHGDQNSNSKTRPTYMACLVIQNVIHGCLTIPEFLHKTGEQESTTTWHTTTVVLQQ